MVDDPDRLVGETPAVGFPAAVVAALDRVLDVAVSAVVVDLLAPGGVDATLCGDRVRAARGVMVGERLDVVAQLTECSRRAAAGEAGADDEDAELAAVEVGDQVVVVLLPFPGVLHRNALGSVIFEDPARGDTVDTGSRLGEVGLGVSFRVSAHSVITFRNLVDPAEGDGQRDGDVAHHDRSGNQVGDEQQDGAGAVSGDTQVADRCEQSV